MADRVVLVPLHPVPDWALLAGALRCAWRVDETPCFAELLQTIDEVDCTRRSGSHVRRRRCAHNAIAGTAQTEPIDDLNPVVSVAEHDGTSSAAVSLGRAALMRSLEAYPFA